MFLSLRKVIPIAGGGGGSAIEAHTPILTIFVSAKYLLTVTPNMMALKWGKCNNWSSEELEIFYLLKKNQLQKCILSSCVP